VRVFALVLVVLVSVSAWAELPPAAPPPAPAPANSGAGTPSYAPANRGITIFNDKVFELSTDQTAPTTRESPSGQKRYLADEPKYNVQTRQEAIDKCSGQEDFKGCFNREMSNSASEVQKNFNRVEDRLSQPFRNQNSISDEPGKKSEPAFGGVEESKEK
jgi:hypothetical protein